MDEPIRITSRDNKHLKLTRSVRDGRETDLIFIEGRRLCAEAARSMIEIEKVFCTDAFLASENGSVVAGEILSKTFIVSAPLLESIADTTTPQGIVIIGRRLENVGVAEQFKNAEHGRLPVWIFLYKTNNPSNIGAAIRTAEAAGVRGIIVSEGSADSFSSKALRASMGSAFRLPITEKADLERCIAAARVAGIEVAALDNKGTTDYLNFNWRRPILLVFGSESAGLPARLASKIKHTLRIGMTLPVESLNLAVSCGVVLFEAARQNRQD